MSLTPPQASLAKTPPEKINNATVAYLANLTETAKVSPAIAASIVRDLADQPRHLNLIASESYCPLGHTADDGKSAAGQIR